jgi:hypothetical protein
MKNESVMVKIQIPENCEICRFNTDTYIECSTHFCTLIGEAIRNTKTINKDCLLMRIKKGEVVYADKNN